jgi:hypothetical protein
MNGVVSPDPVFNTEYNANGKNKIIKRKRLFKMFWFFLRYEYKYPAGIKNRPIGLV